MPNLKTSIKDLRKSQRRETINNRLRNRVKRVTKKHANLVKQGNKEEVKKNLYILPVRINLLQDKKESFNQIILDYVRKNQRNNRLSTQ